MYFIWKSYRSKENPALKKYVMNNDLLWGSNSSKAVAVLKKYLKSEKVLVTKK